MQPSSIAASSWSGGTLAKKLRIITITNGRLNATNTTTRIVYVSSRPEIVPMM